MSMVRSKKSLQGSQDSPESEVSPYEDINTRQSRITGERFPTLALGVCDNCNWCYTLMNERGIVRVCPICNKSISQIPMSLDEICIIEVNEKQGFTVTFDRKLPLR